MKSFKSKFICENYELAKLHCSLLSKIRDFGDSSLAILGIFATSM
jgi:hypothetical protein